MKIDIKTAILIQVRKFAKKHKLDKKAKDELMTICVASYIKGANNIKGINNVIKYQSCPLCNGNGQTVADGFTNSVYQTCKVCNGARIIPMHIANWRFADKA